MYTLPGEKSRTERWETTIRKQYTDKHSTYTYRILKARIARKEVWDIFGPPMFFSPCSPDYWKTADNRKKIYEEAKKYFNQMNELKKETRIGLINRVKAEYYRQNSTYVRRIKDMKDKIRFPDQHEDKYSHNVMRVMSKRVGNSIWTPNVTFFSPICVVKAWEWIVHPIKREKVKLQEDYKKLIIEG